MPKKKIKIYMKEHPKYPGIFVTVNGKIISTTHGELKQHNNHGYLVVHIPGYYNTQGVHRLMAETFIANVDPEVFTQVDHINSIRDDNRIENLRWVTPSENIKKAMNRSTCRKKTTATVPVNQIDPTTNKIVNTFRSIAEACRTTGANKSCVNFCINGLQKTAAGFKWRRAESC